MAGNPDTQAQGETTQTSTVSLAERAKRYCDETERVVRTIGEHPQFELKRALDLSNLRQRIEFVKDLQSIATSEIASEKFLVIGADESTRQFVPVTNLQDFDEAKVRQQLERFRHLSPDSNYSVLEHPKMSRLSCLVVGKQPTRRISREQRLMTLQSKSHEFYLGRAIFGRREPPQGNI